MDTRSNKHFSAQSWYLRGLLVAFALIHVGAPGSSMAQGFGEQRAVQFKYANQGLTNEVYRRQLGAAAASSSSSSSSSSGSGQGGSALNNAVQTSSNLNVTVNGTGNTLNITGDTLKADQNSSGTSQTNENTQATAKGLNY